MRRKKLLTKLVLAVIAISTGVVFGARNEAVGRALNILRPDVKVQISGSVRRSEQAIPLEKIDAVNSGEILDWTINSVNQGNASAQNYRVVGQVPKGTEFVAGSATAENAPKVEYSIDGGRTFSAKPMVEQKQADGSVVQVAAPASSFTQVRFEWSSELPANSQFNAAYKVRVK